MSRAPFLEAKCSDIVSHIQELAKNPLNGVYAMCSSHIPATVSVPDQNGDEVDGSDECVRRTIKQRDIVRRSEDSFSKFFKSTKITC
jgi:hypothetical protein